MSQMRIEDLRNAAVGFKDNTGVSASVSPTSGRWSSPISFVKTSLSFCMMSTSQVSGLREPAPRCFCDKQECHE